MGTGKQYDEEFKKAGNKARKGDWHQGSSR